MASCANRTVASSCGATRRRCVRGVVCSQDGSVKLWRYETGELLQSVDFSGDFQQQQPSSSANRTRDDVNTCAQTQADDLEAAGSKVGDGGGDNVMSRTKGVADVRCLSCCQRNKFAAVSFDK